MQIAPVSVSSYGNYTASVPAPASGTPAPDMVAAPEAFRNTESVETLEEPSAMPASSALALDGGAGTLRQSAGSGGGVPVKMAIAIYSLNLSFDIQAQALDLLA